MAIQKTIRGATLFLFFFLLALPLSFSLGTSQKFNYQNYWNDSFEYAEVFTAHNWEQGAGGCSLTSPYKAQYYGNNVSTCGASGTNSLFNNNFTDSSQSRIINWSFYSADQYMTLKARYYLNNVTSISIGFRDGRVAHEYARLQLGTASLPTSTTNTSGFQWFNAYFEYESDTGGNNCSYSIIRNMWHNVTLYMDFNSLTYWIYEDGERKCDAKKIPRFASGLTSIYIYEAYLEDVPNEVLLDYISLNYSEFSLSEETARPTAKQIAFCDNFDYSSALFTGTSSIYETGGWLPEKAGNEIDTELAPINNQVEFLNNSQGRILRAILPTSNQYAFRTGSSEYSYTPIVPVITVTFLLNISSQSSNSFSSCAYVRGGDSMSYPMFELYFCPNASIFYINSSDEILGTSDVKTLCINCLPNNTETRIYITEYFRQRIGMVYNSTISSDKIEVYTNGSSYSYFPSYPNDDLYNYQLVSMIDFQDTTEVTYTIDDFCAYYGTSRYSDTLFEGLYYTSLYSDLNQSQIIIPTETPTDLVESIKSLYDTLGMESVFSRFFVGLLILAVCNVILVFLSLNYQFPVPAIAYGILNILCCFVLIYLGLIPYWIVIIISLIAVASVGFVILSALNSGG
jgi:hypothetical protein